MNDAAQQKIGSINRMLAPAVIFAAVSAWFFRTFIMGSDLFWHLAAGRDIWQRGSVPKTDPFSYTFGGKEWINHEWLSDVVFWRIYQFGPDAVAWCFIGLFVVIFTLVFLLAYQTTGSIYASGVAVWLSALASHWFLDIRPHVVTLLMVSIILVTRNRKWAPWMWPPLIVLWTNFHAGFVFGIGLVGLIVLVHTVEDSLEAKKLSISWTLWIIVAVCVVAWLVNPFGWRLLGFPWEYLRGNTAYQDIIEWQPPPFGLDPGFFEGGFWWFVILTVIGAYCYCSRAPVWAMAICVGLVTLMSLFNEKAVWCFVLLLALALLFGDRRQLFFIALATVTLAMACKSRRFIPLFSVTAAPLAALSLLYIRDKLSERWPVVNTAWAGLGATLVALLVALGMWSQVHISSSLLRDWAMGDVYPEDQVAWLKETMPDKRVLNYYNWGGLILLHSPDSKIFIDGRANTLYDEDIYNDYLQFLGGQINANRLARYTADVALVPPGRFSAALQKLTPPWRAIHQGAGAILLPPRSPLLKSDLPTVEEIVPDGIEANISRAREALESKQTDEAIQILKSAIEKYPYATRLYSALAQTYAMLNQYDKVSEVFDQGVKENPRRRGSFRGQEGSIFLQARELERALAAFQEAVPDSPFSRREGTLHRIKQIEEEIARKKRGFGP